MMLSRLKEILILGSGVLLLGMASCNKAAEEPNPEVVASVVPAARISMQAQMGENTKASYADRVVSWQVGDQIVLYSNSKVNGILTCTGVDCDGKGSFSGDVVDFAPASVNAFFLGNRTVGLDAHSLTVDFSAQTGLVDNLPAFILLKKTGIVYDDLGGGEYAPASSIAMEALVSVLELKLDAANTPGASADFRASLVTIKGMKNRLTVNFADGTTSAATINEGRTTVAPLSADDYALSYIIGVIPDSGNTDLTVEAQYYYYVDYESTKKTAYLTQCSYAMWTDVDWSSMAAANYYYTDWTSKTLVQASPKGGYNGQAVTGGENASGKDQKKGYNGQDVL